MKDKANGFRGITASSVSRADVRNAKAIRSLALDVDAHVLVDETNRLLDLAKTNQINKSDFVSLIARVENLLPVFQSDFAKQDTKIGVCSYSGFNGEKTGFANNAFSSRVSDGSKPRTNKVATTRVPDATPIVFVWIPPNGKQSKGKWACRKAPKTTITVEKPKVYKGRDARRRSWQQTAPETNGIDTTGAATPFTVSPEFKAEFTAKQTERATRHAAIRQLMKSDNTLAWADAVELYRVKNR